MCEECVSCRKGVLSKPEFLLYDVTIKQRRELMPAGNTDPKPCKEDYNAGIQAV